MGSGRNGTKSRDQDRAVHKGWNWITSVLADRPEMVQDLVLAQLVEPGARSPCTREGTESRAGGIKWQEAASGVVPDAGPSVGTIDGIRSRA